MCSSVVETYVHALTLPTAQVTLHNTRDAVIQVYQERKNLAATLKDTKTVIGRLELLIGFSVHLCFVFFYLLIFRVRRPVIRVQGATPCLDSTDAACMQVPLMKHIMHCALGTG